MANRIGVHISYFAKCVHCTKGYPMKRVVFSPSDPLEILHFFLLIDLKRSHLDIKRPRIDLKSSHMD